MYDEVCMDNGSTSSKPDKWSMMANRSGRTKNVERENFLQGEGKAIEESEKRKLRQPRLPMINSQLSSILVP